MESQELEPLRRAVVPPSQPRRWLYGVIALSIGSAAAAATAAVVVAMREPPAPVEIRLVEMGTFGHWQPPPNTCGHAFLQYTVFRPQLESLHHDVGSLFGIPLRLTCIPGAHGDASVARSAGPDQVFGTADDSCWTSTVTCAELADMRRTQFQNLVAAAAAPTPKAATKAPKKIAPRKPAPVPAPDPDRGAASSPARSDTARSMPRPPR